MSIPEFLSHFGSEAQCAEAIRVARWSDGFRCPRCEGAQHYLVGHDARKLFQCGRRRHQTSLTAGIIMEHSKLPLKTWFLTMHLISQAKTGICALALKRDLGVSYPTVWLLHHNINNAMAQREAARRHGGAGQLDDAYLCGEHSGGKVGRGSENKIPSVAAVSLNAIGQPKYLKLDLVYGSSTEAVTKWPKASLQPNTTVFSDGLACFAAVTDAGCVHTRRVVGAPKPRDLPEFKWVNTVLGNIETMLAGAFKALKFGKFAPSYLAAFAYRFNHRINLRDLIATLIVDVARTRPMPEKAVRSSHAEARF